MVFSQGFRVVYTLGVLFGGLSGRVLAATSWIVPGAVWTDTSGTKIDAHGGQVFQTGTNFYWVSVLSPCNPLSQSFLISCNLSCVC